MAKLKKKKRALNNFKTKKTKKLPLTYSYPHPGKNQKGMKIMHNGMIGT